MLPSVTLITSASKISDISGLITFTSVVAWYPIPQLHISQLPGWIFTSWRI
ncbi:MAG TPA: hypothetical protein VMW20_04620 [Candidatus Nanoarchaeia archaeon]|nr:hypothetical protein [Candidatus Nanoarchaeia archaeon]